MKLLLLALSLISVTEMPTNVGIDQRLNEQLPLELVFNDEAGKSVALGNYFHEKPVVLLFAYTDCPMLCSMVLNDFSKTLKIMNMTPGDEFNVITVSIDPTETPEKAAKTKETYLRRYGRPGAEDGWHFLTGDEASIKSLAAAAGFRYQRDTATGEYMHAAGLMVATPEGKLSRYFFGLEHSPKALELALVEASSNKIGSLIDSVFLYCFHYDPETGKYGLAIKNIMRIMGVGLVLGLGAFVGLSVLRERRSIAGRAA